MTILRAGRIDVLLFALSLTATVAVPPAYGCAFHNVIPEAQLGGMYPGSLSVAVALRNAADAGAIDAAALDAPRTRSALYIDAVGRLQKFRKFLATSPGAPELPASFSLGYVESSLWTRYAQSGGEVAVEIHTDGPAADEPVVLTGEPVVMALLDGTLSVDDAVAGGLIVIIASDTDTAAIRKALTAAAGQHTISLN